MPRFCANLSWLYQEFGLADRLAAAAQDGFTGVECLFPYEMPVQDLSRLAQDAQVQWVLINAPAGNWDQGERGFAARPGETSRFRDSLLRALEYAHGLDCARVHVMAGVIDEDVDPLRAQDTYLNHLSWAADQARASNITLLIEAINGQDMPGYFLQTQQHAHEVVQALNHPHLRVQMDWYHGQKMLGMMNQSEDVWTLFDRYVNDVDALSRIAHMQMASMPERVEPDQVDWDVHALFQRIDQAGYTGWIGCEYRPAQSPAVGATRLGLGWMKPYL